MADPQMYIVVAILLTIAAIVSTFIRETDRFQIPNPHLNHMSIGLMLGAWVGTFHIFWVMLFANSYDAMSTFAVFDFVVHCSILAFIPVSAALWYRLIARFGVSSAGLPTSPSATSDS